MIDPLRPQSLGPARVKLSLTRAQLSGRTGIHETTIMRIESGKVDPRVGGTWSKLVQALQNEEAAQAKRLTKPVSRPSTRKGDVRKSAAA